MPGIVVIGGGMPGMLAAALLAQKGREVTLVEASARLGGLYGSVDYGAHGVFDYGMHMLYDSGIAAVDALQAGLLPESAWHVLEGNRKDIAGVFWNGALQEHSPYIDLRGLPEARKTACLEGVKAAAAAGMGQAEDAQAYFTARFGKECAGYLERVIEKFYGLPAAQVSALAAHQPAMDRVLLMDAEDMGPVFADEGLRARIGYPDQLNLPVERDFAQCGRYPKQMGMQRVVDALAEKLAVLGVRVLLDSKVTRLDVSGGNVHGLLLEQAGKARQEHAGAVFWTAGLAPLAGLLGLAHGTPKLAMAAHVHMRFREEPRMGELYHFYVFDAGFNTFRVTHYANYCEGAAQAGGFPLCVEYWGEGEDDAIIAAAVAELKAFGVVKGDPFFARVRRVPNYHSLFALPAMRAISGMREGIRRMGIGNLFTAGVLAEGGELLLFEIMRDAYAKLGRLEEVL